MVRSPADALCVINCKSITVTQPKKNRIALELGERDGGRERKGGGKGMKRGKGGRKEQ